MLIMSARAKTNTAYQARLGLGQGSIVAAGALLASERESAEILVASVLIWIPQEKEARREYGKDGNNGTDGKVQGFSRLFSVYFVISVFSVLSLRIAIYNSG
jgi:hypothetical protein